MNETRVMPPPAARRVGQPVGLIVVLSISMAVATGCAFVRGNYGDEVQTEYLAEIKKGISTRADVADLLGAPDRIIEANGREIFHYFHYDMKSGTVLVLSRTNVKSNDVFVLFDKNGVVEDVVAGKKRPAVKFQFWPFGS